MTPILLLGGWLGWGGVVGQAEPPSIRKTLVTSEYKVKRAIFIGDGLLGDAYLRLSDGHRRLMQGDVFSVRPNGPRFDPQVTIDTIVEKAYEVQGPYSEIVLVGISMGAKIMHEVAVRLEQNVKLKSKLKALVLIDPLHDGDGPKMGLAKLTRKLKLRPGWPLGSFTFAAESLVNVPEAQRNAHQRQSAATSMLYLADQARYCAGPAVKGAIKAKVVIVAVPPQDDEVLRSHQVERWKDRYPQAEVIWVGSGYSHHAGLDTEPEVWLDPLDKAFQATERSAPLAGATPRMPDIFGRGQPGLFDLAA